MSPGTVPVQLRVAGRRCVVVGGGAVGARRALRLLDAGASVVVVDPAPHAELAGPAGAGAVQLDRRAVGREDGAAGADEVVQGAFLVVAATPSVEVNDAVAAAARARGALVSRADDAAGSDALWSAVAALGPVEVSVGTAGAAPALAAWVADRLDEGLADLLGADAATLEALAELLAELRRERVTRVEGDPAARAGAPDWRSAIDRSMLELISRGRRAEAKERLQACRSSS